jgi:hypothetical protein
LPLALSLWLNPPSTKIILGWVILHEVNQLGLIVQGPTSGGGIFFLNTFYYLGLKLVPRFVLEKKKEKQK